MRVLEAGVGSGALSMTLLRAGAASRPTRSARTSPNTPEERSRRCSATRSTTTSEIRDVTKGIDEADLDRVILDMPEPWEVVEPRRGGAAHRAASCSAYLPTINQTQLLREALRQHSFGLAETVEILRRTWHIDGRSVRPDHRMVAHTGFLTSARRLVGRLEGD